MSESEKPIKVVDRRLFTSEGDLRDEVKAELDAPAPPAAAPAATKPEPEAEPRPASDPAFLRLLDMLGQTAALYLEGMPDPATGRRSVDLNGVRQIVDALLTLREKTRGRLSFEESDVIENLVGELQLTFARLSTAARPPKAPVPPGARRG